MSKVTITDVARHAGVSMKSVSRVINRESNVRAALRTKVEAAIDSLGYKPNLAARSLAGGRSFTIGVLFDNPSPSYTMKIQDGAYNACHKAAYQLVLENVRTSSGNITETMNVMLEHRRIDGMVVTPPATDCGEVLDALERHQIPYVRIAPDKFPDRSMFVSTNDSEATAEAVRHLWSLGHRRFGFISGPPTHGASGWRRAGFYSALRQRDIAPEHVAIAEGDFTFESGIGGGMQLLRAASRPTAIFAANDDMAAGVFAAAGQLNIKIPDMLSVVGFDDSWIAKSVWPSLTTLHQPIEEMAYEAVEMLIAAKQGRSFLAPRHNVSFIVRGSTGPFSEM
ncbi:LacI family DNA-binding transcriptional regulator [Sphingobium sp. 3R8]|uniref:LacI family DNA-binding transcriptional regulator n=1 Tax=Sphingobium sp. 3R8 TaxID=2874921 RepID=UPI001CC9154F|nr:LacI family DNA-binding transcriptional regulator [Sphingobium sp. 3R8]MBZ9649111.1 LacI family DNA-binding transcriptional regulator [Sphingobium sp. 3R8]